MITMKTFAKSISAILLLVLSVFAASAQEKVLVSGRVLSESTSESIVGANVLIKGTTVGTMTDQDGQFTIEASAGQTLEIMCLGMQTIALSVNEKLGRRPLDIFMKDDALFLEDVVVVGYGVQRKQSVVGAISQVKAEDMSRTGGVTNISNALTGLVPGLTTLNYSGKPGADDAEIIIRAKSTWNGASPLVLVDGVEREMNDLDVSEVETISVLKDASATAVFGVRGGNGVILVTTKRGRDGKPVMSASAQVTAKTRSKMAEHLNSYEALWLRNQAIENQLAVSPTSWSYITPTALLKKYRDQTDPYMFPDVDWTDEMIRDCAWSQKYNWDIKGGTKFVKYYASLAYTYDGDILKGRDFGQGYIPKNDYSRYNYRLNLDFHPTRTTKISVDLDGAVGVEKSSNASPAYLWQGVYAKGPDQYPVQYEDGTLANNENGYNMYNPVELFNYSGTTKETRMDINVSVGLDQKLDFITKGLSLKALVNFRNFYYSTGPDISAVRPLTKYVDWKTGDTIWNTPSSWNSSHGFEFGMAENTVSLETAKTNVFKNLMYQVSLNYDRTFGKHHVGALALFKRIEQARGSNFPSYREEWAGRVTYDYDGRYLLEINGAYNGSEKFMKGNKFGFFPSAAVGWVLTEEPFIRRSVIRDYVDLFKIRYSWGKVGSDNNIPQWLYITQWSRIKNSAVLGSPDAVVPPYSGFEVSNIGNEEAKWETAVKNDVAIETAFFKSRLRFTFDYFWGRRYDIFMNASQRNIPPWYGADPVAANIGETKEHGYEVELHWNHKLECGFNYRIGAMMSYAKDIIIYMEDPELAHPYQKKAGFQIGQQSAILSDGLITNWDEMYTSVTGDKYSQAVIGMYRMVDYNGDGIVDNDDIVPYGYPNHPQYNFNLTLGLGWKNLSFMLQFYGTRNSTLYQAPGEFPAPNYYSVVDRDVAEDMWIPGVNPQGTHHAPVYMLSGNAEGTCEYYYRDGTMWRLKNAEIAYKLDGWYLKKVGISAINIYLNGNNLWLYSHLNEDRETGGKRDHSHVSAYPITRRFNLGVKVQF